MSWPLSPTCVFLAVQPIDIRKGADGLSVLVQESLGKAPTDGNAYAFRNRAGSRIKLLVWDGTGVWLCVRRLHKGRFIWPTCNEAIFKVKAYEGPLPDGRQGFEFWTNVAPDVGHVPKQPIWGGTGERPGVIYSDGKAIICVVVTKVGCQ